VSEKPNIYQRLNAVREAVGYIKKDKTVQGYRAVTHDYVTACVREHLIKHGVMIVLRQQQGACVVIGTTKNETPIIRYEAWYDIDFVNCDKPEEKVTVTIESHANDHGDKAPGKAASYATKYAMLKIFSIETGEDEESRVDVEQRAKPITAAQLQDLAKLMIETNTENDAFISYLNKQPGVRIQTLADIKGGTFDFAMQRLQAKKQQMVSA
jgi:hypothetical protein